MTTSPPRPKGQAVRPGIARVRAIAAALALFVSAFSGCLGAEEASSVEPLAEDVSPAGTDAQAPPAAASSSSEPEFIFDPQPTPPPTPPPDPCVVAPALGLDDPCIADGFEFGETAFWDGGPLPGVQDTGTADTCVKAGGCMDTTFEVAETAPGARLRVDVQVFFRDPSDVRTVPDTYTGHETMIEVALFPPGAELTPGNEAAWGDTSGTFAASVFVGGYDFDTREALDGPATGTWTMRVNGLLPDDMGYRLRARLEPPTPPSDEVAYPDMRIIAPFDIGFMVPTSTFHAGLPTPTAVPVAGCMAEEYLEGQRNGLERPTLCLRFSMGFANAGSGAFRLKMPPGSDAAPADRTSEGPELPIVQSVCTADNRLCRDLERPEGLVARWDPAHEHYHYQNAYVFELYRVVASGDEGAPPELEFVSTSGKLGIDPGPEAFVGWNSSFAQSVHPWAPDGKGVDGSDDVADKHLMAGWGDVYDWNRAGNYVPFPADAAMRPVAGEYLLRGATDPERQIAEMDDANNDGYTWFTVDSLGGVEILERGYGADPWDEFKAVLDVTP